MNEKLMEDIKKLMKLAENNSDTAAAGYDEGFYVGKAEAFEEVLELMKEFSEQENKWIPISSGVVPKESRYYEVTVRERIIGTKPHAYMLYYDKDTDNWYEVDGKDILYILYTQHVLAWKENSVPYKDGIKNVKD